KLRKPESDAGDGGGGISNITTGVVLWTNPFTDVSENDWFYDSVRFVNENGLFAGVSSKEFAPHDTMTRGMLVTVLHRLAGKPQASASKFTDAPAGAWFADAVAWASENSIVNGIGNNKFAPNRAITREEMAVIMYNYAKSKGLDVSGKGDLTKFTDGNKVSAWAADAMSWAISVGLISGRGNGRLDPGGKATRAENAAIIQRFAAYVGPAAK
ncbi:MAG: S-layer homology domain-containing protein, partial [Clostridiales bacterium]|nr:S-layer homology domain-containing protein [Clostridiales bacterium]